MNNLELIRLTVAKAKAYPEGKVSYIEYNFRELPEHPMVKEDKFFGVPSKLNKGREVNTLNIIYKMF